MPDGKTFEEEIAKHKAAHDAWDESCWGLSGNPLWNVCDLMADGWDMIHIATRAHVFAGVGVSGMHDAMLEKVMLYNSTHPDEHDCISVEEFEDIWHKALDEARKIYFENQAQV